MKTAFIRAAAGAAAVAAGLAGAQTYSTYPSSTYPSYGYGGASGIVRCESINSRSNFCRVDTRGGVQLHRQLSRENCIRGRNWEVRSDGILVDDGCRAEFALGSAYQAGTRTIIGTDRYGRPIYSTTGTYGGGYATDRYGRPIYDNTGTHGGGYPTDRYGRPIYDDRCGGYSNGGYPDDQYGRRVYVGSTGGYTTDRYGNRVYVGTGGVYDDGYTYDQYGNRVPVDSGGYWATDRYGRRVWVQSSGYGRVYDDDYSTADRVYDNNQAMGYPGTTPVYGGTPPVYTGSPQVEVIRGGTSTSPSTYGTGVIHCQAGVSGKAYCGDRNETYTIHQDTPVGCVLNQTYGRDSGGYWVSSG